MSTEDEDDDDEEEEDVEESKSESVMDHPDYVKLRNYRMQQQVLLQLRATLLSEEMARRGLPITTLVDAVTTPDRARPKPVDWDCAMVTVKERKTCLVCFDAQINTKVIAPLNSTEWITLKLLNQMRRTDPSKVEGMWFDKYSILRSWFDPSSEYSVLQHTGVEGFLLHNLLQGSRLNYVMAMAMIISSIIFLPLLEYIVNRFLVSSFVWSSWFSWARFVHAAFPFKFLMGQIVFKMLAVVYFRLVGFVKERLIDLESELLESRLPLTVGAGSQIEVDDGNGAAKVNGSADSAATDEDEDGAWDGEESEDSGMSDDDDVSDDGSDGGSDSEVASDEDEDIDDFFDDDDE